MEGTNVRRGWARGWALLVVSAACVIGASGEARSDDGARREAMRVLARGQELPAGMTSLRVERPTVFLDMSGRGEPRHRRRPSIVGTFELDGAAIGFQTIRGRRLRRRWRDADDPRHELEVCFKDGEGRPFMVQLGGDEVLDPACDPELMEPPDEAEGLDARLSVGGEEAPFAIAAAALEALAGVEFRRRFADEYAALVGHAQLAATTQQGIEPDCEAEDTYCEEDVGQADGGLIAQSHNNRWRHILEVWSGPLSRVPGATHGATIAFRQDPRNNRVTMAWHRCNHGRCYYGRNMRFQCAFWSRFDRQYHVHRETCTTRYSPRSGADWWWPGHNSNDDTSIQYRAVRNDRHYPSGWGSGWPCDDPYTHDRASGCF